MDEPIRMYMLGTTGETTGTTTARGVSLNALSNAVVVAFEMGTSVLLMAFILRVLSREMYGLWAVTGAVFAYSTLLQLGLNSAVNYFVPSLLLKKNYVELSRVASTAIVFYCAGSVILLLVTAILVVYFPSWFRIPETAIATARITVVLVGAYFVLAVPLSVFQGLLSGLQRYVAMNVTRLICRVARVVLIVTLLLFGFGVVGLAIGHVVGRLAESLAMPFLVRRYLPQLTLSPSLASWSVFRKMFSHCGFTLLWSFASLVRDRASFVVIGVFLGAGVAGAYQIPVMLMQAFDAIPQALAAVTKPATSALVAEGRHSAIESLVLRGSRFLVAIFIPLTVFVALYAEVFIPIWVGESYADAAGLVSLLVLAQAPLTGQAITTYVIIGMDRHQSLAIVTMISALVGLALSTALVTVGDLGLWGVACGAALSMLFMGVLVLPMIACGVLKIKWVRYMWTVFAVPLLAALPFVSLLVAARFWVQPVELWTVVVVAILSLPVLVVSDYFMVLSKDERRRVTMKVSAFRFGRNAK